MGLLSSSHTIARYIVEGEIEDSILETIRQGLKKNTISEIEDEYAEITTGWVPFESHFDPDFERFAFSYGNIFLFCLRIDKKSVPAKIVKKHTTIEIQKRLKESGRDFLSKNEKTDIKDTVIEQLMRRIPSTPNVYDVLWNYDESEVIFFTTQKAANEELETLFSHSFNLKLIRWFPYTMVEKNKSLAQEEKDRILSLPPTHFSK